MNGHLDFESRSKISLPDVGAWRYAQDPSTNVTALTFGTCPADLVTVHGLQVRFDWSPRNVSRFGIDPAAFAHHFITAHSAQFENAIYSLILHRRFGWPARWDASKWGCTQARAAQVGLPLDLDTLGRVLQIKTPKDLEGRRIMLQLSASRADGTFDESPEKYARMAAYNRTDVLGEMEIDVLLPQLTPFERPIWEHDLVANRRGVAVDLELAEKAEGFADRITKGLNARLLRLTGGGVTKASQVAELKNWVSAQGITGIESLDKVGLLQLMERPDVSQKTKEVVKIRQQVGKSSTAKYRKTIEAAGADCRVRGVLQYHAAHTGRWGGRLIQPQNYPHGFKPAEQAVAVDLILAGDFDGFSARYGEGSMAALANVLRGTIVAGEGKVLVAADLNAIEPCVLMTLAGEKEICEQLRKKIKPYMPLAQRIYQNPNLTKEKDQTAYDIGKRAFLGCGYGLGWKSFQQRTYEETAKMGNSLLIPDDLSQRAVDTYRETYPGVPALWKEMETAAIMAVKNPGTNYVTAGGRVVWGMTKDRRFLVARLPSGRFLWYYKPEIRMVDTPWGEKKEAMCYWGLDRYTKKWSLLKTYGGLLTENVVSAIARDIMALGMLAISKIHDLFAILTVHDEAVGEGKDRPGLLQLFIDAMCKNLPPWTNDFPINADGWVGKRYHKE